MPRDSLPIRFAVGAIAVTAALHMVAVTIAGLPSNAMSQAATPATSYLSPYFAQNWRLFAPDPISADRTFWVQGEYAKPDSSRQRTGWLNWTAIELDLIHHHLVGGRAGYVTNKMLGPIGKAFARLTRGQRDIAAHNRQAATNFDTLRLALLAESQLPKTIEHYLSYERTAVRLATAALQAAHPDVDLTGVRYRVGNQPVTPYRLRTATPVDGHRPAASFRESGWRPPLKADAREQRAIDDFWNRHR